MLDFRIQLVIVVAILFLLNRTINGALQKLGLQKSDEDIKDEKKIKELESSEYWKPSYYKDLLKKYPQKNRVALSNANTVEAYAKQFNSAKGLFNDDEEKVYGIIRSMKYGTQLSQVSERFFVMYKKDLYNFLQGFMSDSELLKLAEIVSQLETGLLKPKK